MVEVQPSDLPPVRFKGRVHVRIGPRRAIATQQDERRLTERRISHARSFDALPCLDSSIEDLERHLFETTYLLQAVAPEVIAENNRDLAAQMASLRFYDPRAKCPTNAGIILFGKNSVYWMPGAYVQFLQIEGKTFSSAIKNEIKLSGDLLSVLRRIEALLDVHIVSRPEWVSTAREQQLTNYPRIALREILFNAVLHRSYESNSPVRFYWFSDHIEIQSPGGLYGEVSPENFPRQSSYRNPVLAEAMKALGFVNRFGYGVARAQESLAHNGNPPAEFVFDPHFVLVKLRAHNDEDNRIL